MIRAGGGTTHLFLLVVHSLSCYRVKLSMKGNQLYVTCIWYHRNCEGERGGGMCQGQSAHCSRLLLPASSSRPPPGLPLRTWHKDMTPDPYSKPLSSCALVRPTSFRLFIFAHAFPSTQNVLSALLCLENSSILLRLNSSRTAAKLP